MATSYTAQINKKPPKIIANAAPGYILPYITNTGDNAEIEYSEDGGLSYRTFKFTVPSNFNLPTYADVAGYLNNNLRSVLPNQFLWEYDSQLGRFTVTLQNPSPLARLKYRGAGDINELLVAQGFTGSFTVGPTDFFEFNDLINMPSDGDPFTAFSVNMFEKPLLDRDYFLYTRFGGIPRKLNHYDIKRIPGVADNVLIQPFVTEVQYLAKPFIIELKTPITLTPTLAANKVYYLYVAYNGTSLVFTFEEDTVTPVDDYNLFADGDPTKKFLTSMITDGAGKIVPFYKYANLVSYYDPQIILTNGDQPSGMMGPPNFVNVYPYVPVSGQLLINLRLVLIDKYGTNIIMDLTRSDTSNFTVYAHRGLGPTLTEGHTDYNVWFSMQPGTTAGLRYGMNPAIVVPGVADGWGSIYINAYYE